MEKMGKGGGGGEEKIRLPAGLVRLQNPYTRWTGALSVGCNLIDAFQSKVVNLLADSLTFDDALTESPPPPPLSIFGSRTIFRAGKTPKIPFLGLFLLPNPTEPLATQASHTKKFASLCANRITKTKNW